MKRAVELPLPRATDSRSQYSHALHPFPSRRFRELSRLSRSRCAATKIQEDVTRINPLEWNFEPQEESWDGNKNILRFFFNSTVKTRQICRGKKCLAIELTIKRNTENHHSSDIFNAWSFSFITSSHTLQSPSIPDSHTKFSCLFFSQDIIVEVFGVDLWYDRNSLLLPIYIRITTI